MTILGNGWEKSMKADRTKKATPQFWAINHTNLLTKTKGSNMSNLSKSSVCWCFIWSERRDIFKVTHHEHPFWAFVHQPTHSVETVCLCRDVVTAVKRLYFIVLLPVHHEHPFWAFVHQPTHSVETVCLCRDVVTAVKRLYFIVLLPVHVLFPQDSKPKYDVKITSGVEVHTCNLIAHFHICHSRT